jgi:hypothetical protein
MANRSEKPEPKRRWREYETPAGKRPVREFLEDLSDNEAAVVLEAMRDVREKGNRAEGWPR